MKERADVSFVSSKDKYTPQKSERKIIDSYKLANEFGSLQETIATTTYSYMQDIRRNIYSKEIEQNRLTVLANKDRYEKLREKILAIDNGEITVSTEQRLTYSLLEIGAMLKQSEDYKRIKQLLSKQVASETIKKLFDLYDFSFPGGANLKLGKISLADISEQKASKKLSIPSILHYSMEALLMNGRTLPSDYFPENDTPLVKEFPMCTTWKLFDTTSNFGNVINMLSAPLNPEMRIIMHQYPEYTKKARDFMKKMVKFHENFQQILFEPESEEFPEIRKMIKRYFSIDKGVMAITIHFFSQSDDVVLQNLYKQAKRLHTHPSQGEFYKLLTGAIEEYTELIQPFSKLLIFDDLETVFSSHTKKQSPLNSFDSLKSSSTKIFSKSSQLMYEVDASTIDWVDLVQPHFVKIAFNKNRATLFTIELGYTSEEEERNIRLTFDTKKREFNWNFLESPDDEKMQDFYSNLLTVSQALLEKIEQQVNAQYQSKQQPTEKVVFSPPVKGTK